MDFSHINVIKYGISVLVILLERTNRMAAQRSCFAMMLLRSDVASQ
jgi:hypothetical protein